MKRVFIIIFAVSVLFAGCTDDLLDKKPLSSLSNTTFWKNGKDAELALMGCYDGMQSKMLYRGEGYQGGSGVTQFDFLTDDGYVVWSWMKFVPLSTGRFTATSWGNNTYWADCYKVIARANQIIHFVPGIEGMDKEQSLKIVAEAKVLRATVYNLLTMTYGDVPLITGIQNIADAKVAKNSKEEVVSFIIDDLEECYDHLPKQAEWGRITKGAALGILSRIYLYNKEWANAAETAKKVIDLGVYSLYPDYQQLFKPENEKNAEVIFPITFSSGLGQEGSKWMSYYSSRGYVNYRAALPNLVDEFYYTDGLPASQSKRFDATDITLNRDPRMIATMTSRGWPGWRGGTRENEGVFFPNKYIAENSEFRNDSPQDFYLIRYAHILLIRAEALAQQGTHRDIYTLLNEVRDRAGMPSVEEVEGAGLSQAELLKLVKHERRVETAFEGLRYFDLKRWNEIKEKYDYYNANEYNNYQGVAGEKYYKSMQERVWLEKYNKWPIPQTELDANDNLIQNDGY